MENILNKAPVVYKDFSNDLDIHPLRKDIAVLENEEAVKRALKNLLLTNFNERFFNPLFGSNIRSYLFENFSQTTELDIRDSIKTAIKNFEPRVNLLNVKVTPSIDNNNMNVTIIFNCLNNINDTVLEFILERVR